MFIDRDHRASGRVSCAGRVSASAPLTTSLPLRPPGSAHALTSVNLDRPSLAGASAATVSAATVSTATVSTTTASEPASAAATDKASSPSATATVRPLKLSADFNNDGQTDILWRNYATGENEVWLMNGTAIAKEVAIAPLGDTNWRIEGVNNFTGDGRLDIVWRNYKTGENALWFMNGTTRVSSTYLLPLGDTNWQIQGVVDFTGDGNPDLLWRNYATGQNAIWAFNGTTRTATAYLPPAAGVNLRIQAAGDFDLDGKPEIIWRNTLSGENFIWSLNATTLSSITIASTTFLPSWSDADWQIQGVVGGSADTKHNLLWRNVATGENRVWVLDGLKYTGQRVDLPNQDTNWRIGLQDTFIAPSTVKVSGLSFSGLEGDMGTFKVQLTQAPTSNVTLTFSAGSFTVVDADGSVANGTQTTLTFTPQNWQTARTVSFIAEDDNVSTDRLLGNTVSYTLSGGLTGSATYELGKVTNTYAPDPNHFNIDLDFRNDPLGFWTSARRAIAQKAAADWASKIANEWTDFQLSGTLNKLDANSTRPYSFTSKRYVDDLLIFLNPYQGNAGLEAGNGGPDYQFGGWISSPELMPRVGQIALNADSFSTANDPTGTLLYQVVTHEIGHVLGLVGLDWIGYNLVDRTTPQTAVFKGDYAKAANGGNYIPLQSQDGANPVTGTYDYSHPSDSVQSILSYGWLYRLEAPTTIDYAMLADSGYRVYGFNA